MKNTLIIILFIFSTIASATDYYISSSGNDANNGLSSSTPWKTIGKVNSAFSIMKPGDRILFNRGDTFYGTITVTKSGSAGSPIVISAYGSGVNPIITGFTTITGWTNEGNGIYSKFITSASPINMVTIDGVNKGMGRYPNSTYLTYESFSTNVSITDNGLGDATNWTGAEAVIRKNDWTLDRCTITNHTGDVLTYTSLGTNQNALANFGYFIQNDLRTLDIFGEWYYNSKSSTFYMYFGIQTPGNYAVVVSTIDNLLYDYSYDYITIDNISFKGSNKSALFFNGYYAESINIQNCKIDFSGSDGIYMEGCRNTLVNNNYINHSSRAGIYVKLGGNNNITNNTIKNSGLISGIPNTATECDGIYFIQSTISDAPQGSLIQYNNIDSSGYNGIYLAGNNLEIRNNFINNSALLLDDAGGIYTGNEAATGRIIDGNIILNSFGNNSGTSNNISKSEGIYLDDHASNIKITNNTVANCSNDGIKLHMAHDNIIQNNIAFNNLNGIGFENWTGLNAIYKNSLTGNIFFAKSPTQHALLFSTNVNEIPGFGTADNNYYLRPIDDDDVFHTNQPSSTTTTSYITLAGWQSLTNQDANSHKSPIAITNNNDIKFEYNASKTNKVITLDQPMIDVKGIKYINNITLLPFTSVILMVDPNPAQPVIPVYTGSVIGNTTPALLEITYTVSLVNIVPAASSFTATVNSVARTVNSVAISGAKVLLTLASPIVYGDVVTVSYTKPSSNPLQTTSGGQAVNISAQPVTNNVNSIVPVYVSSVIASSTPSILEMTYTLSLANIVPAAASFSVRVNSVARTVNTVATSGTKVLLTLAGPIVHGDVVTVAYTKPSTNPLQTTSGGQAATISAQPVANNCINVAPTIVITSPINNSSFATIANITITANANDADGSISMVEFYNGSIKLGSKAAVPYSFTWNNVAAGNYSITVVAIDNLNSKTISSAISISVINGSTSNNQLPVIKISNPIKGNKYFPNSTITIDAIASDPDGAISKVEFYNGLVKLVELTSTPYSFTWKDVAAGSYSITAIATDNLNGTTVSSPVEFVVGSIIKYDANSEIIKLYPNPSDGHFSIEFISPLRNEKSEIVITDLAGKQVYNGLVSKEETLKQFDLSNSTSGIYIMMIKDEKILVTKKIIIK